MNFIEKYRKGVDHILFLCYYKIVVNNKQEKTQKLNIERMDLNVY